MAVIPYAPSYSYHRQNKLIAAKKKFFSGNNRLNKIRKKTNEKIALFYVNERRIKIALAKEISD